MDSLKRTVQRRALKRTSKRIRADSVLTSLRCNPPESSVDSDEESDSAAADDNVVDVDVSLEDECLPAAVDDLGTGDCEDWLGDGDDELCGGESGEGSVHNSTAESDDDDAASQSSVEDGPPVFENDAAKEQYIIDTVRGWGQEPGMLSMTKLDDLLHRLSVVFPRMPLTYRTLFNCDYNYDITELPSGGTLWFKGIRSNLDSLDLGQYLEKFKKVLLDIGIDGLPLVRSKLWPILGDLVGTDNPPFIIAVFRNTKDPDNVHHFLEKFVKELKELMQNGYSYGGQVYPVLIRNYILDAPARSFIKCCVRHNAYSSCERCTVIGEYHNNRVTYGDLDQPLRTDESYRQREQPEHHTGDSPLEALGTGMVSQFPLDPMHLVYAGVFKRLLEHWLYIVGPWKLHIDIIEVISSVFEFLKPYCPWDFNRKPCSLKFFKRMKCTQLRRMLLYDGILVFKDLVDDNIYKHFLLLHCSMYILSSRHLLSVHRDSAKQFIRTFISHAIRIYGLSFVVYNVHSLLHLVDECDRGLILEEFSAFKFENKLKSIKDTLRSGLHELQQLARRDEEKSSRKVVLTSKASHVVLSIKQRGLRGIAGKHYRRLKAGKLLLRVGKSDGCFSTKTGDIIMLKDIYVKEKKIYLVGCKFLKQEDFYDYPLPSSELGIVKLSQFERKLQTYRIRDVQSKCYLMPDGDNFVSVPILHSSECM